jgi:hypothetical protein
MICSFAAELKRAKAEGTKMSRYKRRRKERKAAIFFFSQMRWLPAE